MNDGNDLFKQLNNALLDLQMADLQGYARPLKKIGRLLRHAELEPFNAKLIDGVDLDAFIAAGERTQGGMIGSAELEWPEDGREELGLQLLLILKFSDNPDYMTDFGHQFYYSGSKLLSNINAVTTHVIIPFMRDYKQYVLSSGDDTLRVVRSHSKKIFIVHGHDGEAREAVARFLEKLEFEAVILHEQPNQNKTIIEKVEANSDAGFAVVLLTPDDVGRSSAASALEPRARQNVLLELGYFMGLLKRERVCALRKGEVSIPSDFAGVAWTDMDAGGAWKQALAKELQAAGYTIEWNKIMR